jgi:hypothetical protein
VLILSTPEPQVKPGSRVFDHYRERRVLTRVSRTAWRLSRPSENGRGAGPGPRRGDLDPHLRPGDDWPGTANVAAGLARVAAVLSRTASDPGELARARRAAELIIAAVLPSRRAERRRRLAEPDLDFRTFLPHQADARLRAGADGTTL